VKISVCIGSVRPLGLAAAIAAIERQSWTDWELIVVGQGPDLALRAVGEAATKRDRRVRYIHLDRRGVSLARNVAVGAATGDIIAITDDDCEAREDWLAVIAGCFSADPKVEVVGGAMIAPTDARRRLANCPEFIPSEALYDPISSAGKPPAGWNWVTANVAFRPAVLARAGPFDECFGPGAIFRVGTDTEYKARLERLGVRMRSTPRAVVFHSSGCRYGMAILRRAVDYAWGNGALAGKLTLLGDPRGREWLETQRRELTVGWLRPPRPHRLPLSALRLWHFTRGYRRCVGDYRVDRSRGVLEPSRSLAV
jgi:glycosyltransferase involved in cell wall biosynthesis